MESSFYTLSMTQADKSSVYHVVILQVKVCLLYDRARGAVPIEFKARLGAAEAPQPSASHAAVRGHVGNRATHHTLHHRANELCDRQSDPVFRSSTIIRFYLPYVR